MPDSPEYEASISAETLLEAQKMFYYLFHCPNLRETRLDLKNLFSQLINSRFPMKTVFLTLIRMFFTASEKKKENERIITLKGALKK